MSSYDPENLLLTGGFQSNLAPSAKASAMAPSSDFSIRPITLKIASTVPLTGDESNPTYIYQGNKLDIVRVVGKVEDIVTRKKGATYMLNDGTGTMKLEQFVDIADEESDKDFQSPFHKGQHVIVHARLKKKNSSSDIVLSVRKIEPVVDFNVITRHLLEVIQSHLYHEGQLKVHQKNETHNA